MAYCQLLHLLRPKSLPLSKVNTSPKNEYENLGNLKLFQSGLLKLQISRAVDIEKLAKARYQDNLEMIQWLRHFLIENGVAGGEPRERVESVPVKRAGKENKRGNSERKDAERLLEQIRAVVAREGSPAEKYEQIAGLLSHE